jgi:hypothetical protein
MVSASVDTGLAMFVVSLAVLTDINDVRIRMRRELCYERSQILDVP